MNDSAGVQVGVADAGESDASRKSRRRWLAAILLIAFALRIGVALALPTSDYPDEIFQTREPAHRLAYGYGVVTWEFRVGARSWVLPAALAVVMRATDWIAPGSLGYSIGILVVLSAMSLGAVWVGFAWGHRAGGIAAAVLTAAVCALWYDLVYFAPQALSEVVAGDLLLPGLLLADTADGASRPAGWGSARSRLILAGVLCGAAMMVRHHLAPAVLVALLWVCRGNRRKWALMGGGLALPVLGFGLVDAFTWGAPFASYVRSVIVQAIQHKAASFGKMPPLWLFEQIGIRFGPLLILCVPGIRRARLLALTALTIVATHSLFAHKEFRFVYPALPMLCVLVGLGISALFERLVAQPERSKGWIAVAVLCIASSSALWGASYGTWDNGTGTIRAFRAMSARGDVCGVAVGDWFDSGGYAYLHHNVPIYVLGGNFPHPASAFNYAAVGHLDPKQYPQYRVEGCWANSCLYKRAGGCSPVAGYSLNDALRQLGR